jgi:two-component system response regulator ChvI
MREAYPEDVWVAERTVDSHVKRIRRKLALARASAVAIETVHGLGYRLVEL